MLVRKKQKRTTTYSPQSLPDEICAACGQPLDTPDWVVLGSGQLIHYGGEHLLDCFQTINDNSN